MPKDTRAPVVVIALIAGLFGGWVLHSLVIHQGKDITASEHDRDQTPVAESPADNGNSSAPEQQPSEQSQAGGASARNGHGGMEASMAKANFMQKFVAALVAKPGEIQANPQWMSPLKDPSNPIKCADCHGQTGLNIEAMKKNALSDARAAPYLKDKSFMVPLMEAWVTRLNLLHASRLKKLVTCTTCHEKNPAGLVKMPNNVQMPLFYYRDPRFLYYMVTFTRALTQKPTANREPAKDWKPLLKDPSKQPVECSTCHTARGIPNMNDMLHAIPEQRLQAMAPPEKFRESAYFKPYMIHLMEAWVGRLNHMARDKLAKAVTCRDCHQTDPRG